MNASVIGGNRDNWGLSSGVPKGTVLWDRVKKKSIAQDWAGAWVAELEKRFWRDRSVFPEDPPLEQTEWTHHYFCDLCASLLQFDPQKPAAHACPTCGRVYDDAMRNGAWRTHLHNAIMRQAESAAILARIFPESGDHVRFIRKAFLFYAGHYADYPVHGVRAGKGKVMPQSLDEAVWLVRFGRILRWEKDREWFSPDERDRLRENLFRPAAELLKAQIHKIHNIHVWLNSAVAACAWVLGDEELLDWTIEGEFGWRRQLEKGVNADGFWWENSIPYHFYSFQAFAGLALAAADAGRPLWDSEKFRMMLLAPLDLAYADGTLPAHNDAWRACLSDYADCYELGAGFWPDAGLDAALGRIYRDASENGRGAAAGRSSNEALLYGPETLPVAEKRPPASRLFKASGLGILENRLVRICLKAGPHGGGHDHGDKLNVDVVAANGWKSEDLGTSGYGAEITRRWYQQPAAHNIPVINQSRQADLDAVMPEFGPDRMCGKAEEICPGVSLWRSIELTPDGWKDETRVEGAVSGQVDWCFHGSGHLETGLPLEPVSQAGTRGGFDWLRDVRRGRADGDWQAEWKDGRALVRLHFKGVPGTEIFIGEGDGNPARQKLGVVIVRRRSAPAVFEGRFEIL